MKRFCIQQWKILRQLDIMIGEGPAARSIKIDLPSFYFDFRNHSCWLTGSLLRDRFGITQRLEYYKVEDLSKHRSAQR
ncbi:hypothetical protein O9929_11095 [Vibrio lentus]|nr:hypothetical protein [Vibrio lentus]